MRTRMTVATISALLLISALLCAAEKAHAQDQTGSTQLGADQPAKPDEPDCCKALRERLAKLQQEMANLENDVKKLEGQLKANDVQLELKHTQDFKRLTESVLKNQTVVVQNLQRIGDNSDKIAANGDSIDANADTIKANAKKIGSNELILRDIVRYDAEAGEYVPDLLAKMQHSRSFRQEMQKAVEGKLWIYNNHPYEQIIHINGTRWRARIGRSYVFVPLGHVAVTHITGSTPKYRNDWKFDEKEQQWMLVFDFDKPW